MNDLAVTNLDLWKYVDDITGSEITGKEAIMQSGKHGRKRNLRLVYQS